MSDQEGALPPVEAPENHDQCCTQMAYAITADDLAFHYSARLREYGIDYKGGGSFQEIEYCPWCGKKLPPPLTEEWYDRVRELGFENPWLVEDDDLPEDLRTDRWWKQAGL